MKKKITLSILVIVLAAALIIGATGAWFTDDAEVPEAEFLAGTVLVDVDDPSIQTMQGRFFDNVNPGDCATITWLIKNTGTKNAELRVQLGKEWESNAGSVLLPKINEEFGTNFDKAQLTDNLNALEGNEATNVVYYAPAPNSGWEIYEAQDGLWLYYTAGPVDGTYYAEDDGYDGDVELPLVIYFDGEQMDNRYMKANFRIDGVVEAVQATNGAPAAVWGSSWEAVNAQDYVPAGLAADYLNAVKGTKCWNGGGEVEPPEDDKYEVTALVEAEGNGTVSGVDAAGYEEGDEVELTAAANPGFEFVRWEVVSGGVTLSSLTDATITFTMPAGPVTVKAVFEEEEVIVPVCTTIVISGDSGITRPGKQMVGPYWVDTSIPKQYTAVVKDQFENVMDGASVNWSVTPNGKGVSIDASGVLTVSSSPNENNTITIHATCGSVEKTYNVTISKHNYY